MVDPKTPPVNLASDSAASAASSTDATTSHRSRLNGAAFDGDGLFKAATDAYWAFGKQMSLHYFLEYLSRPSDLVKAEYIGQIVHDRHYKALADEAILHVNRLIGLIVLDEAGAKCPKSIADEQKALQSALLAINPRQVFSERLPSSPDDMAALITSATKTIRDAVVAEKKKIAASELRGARSGGGGPNL